MPIDTDSVSEEGLIRLGGREYGTRAYLAKIFNRCERTIARWDLPRIKVGNLNLHDLNRIPERLAKYEKGGRGPGGGGNASSA